MNGLLLIISYHTSTVNHQPHHALQSFVRLFGHLLVIKINFSATKQSTKIRLFKIKNLKFWRRGHCPPSHSRIEEGPLPIPHTARVPRFDLLQRSTSPSCFWTIRALDWTRTLAALLTIFFKQDQRRVAEVPGNAHLISFARCRPTQPYAAALHERPAAAAALCCCWCCCV